TYKEESRADLPLYRVTAFCFADFAIVAIAVGLVVIAVEPLAFAAVVAYQLVPVVALVALVAVLVAVAVELVAIAADSHLLEPAARLVVLPGRLVGVVVGFVVS